MLAPYRARAVRLAGVHPEPVRAHEAAAAARADVRRAVARAHVRQVGGGGARLVAAQPALVHVAAVSPLVLAGLAPGDSIVTAAK